METRSAGFSLSVSMNFLFSFVLGQCFLSMVSLIEHLADANIHVQLPAAVQAAVQAHLMLVRPASFACCKCC
jgi:hypothetical protein